MRLSTFNYLAPKSVSEACSMLKDHPGDVAVMAGGTDLLVSMKQRVNSRKHVMSLKEIPDSTGITPNGESIHIGMLTPLRVIESSPVIKEHFPALAEAAHSVATPHIRNMGTLGGNICLDTRCCYYNQSLFFRKSMDVCLKFGGDVCHVVKKGKRCFAISNADTVPELIALGAKVKIQTKDEARIAPLEDLYQDDGKEYINLKSDALITQVQIPMPDAGTGGSYQKLRLRKAIDFALAGAAVNLTIKNGVCENVRVILGSLGSSPIRVERAEETLNGKKPTDDVIEEAAEFAYKYAKPVANIVDVSPSYRKEMARVMMRRATKEAVSRAG